jgi:hypothetical protein
VKREGNGRFEIPAENIRHGRPEDGEGTSSVCSRKPMNEKYISRVQRRRNKNGKRSQEFTRVELPEQSGQGEGKGPEAKGVKLRKRGDVTDTDRIAGNGYSREWSGGRAHRAWNFRKAVGSITGPSLVDPNRQSGAGCRSGWDADRLGSRSCSEVVGA